MVASARPNFIFDARIPMRDGVELSGDVYLPGESGRYPAIICRTPYDNANAELVHNGEFFARQGYAFVACDVRGRGDSDGHFTPFRGERLDGYDTVEWVASQPWCNGRVGMMGGSYACSTQWWAACEHPPHLVTLVSRAVSGRNVQSPQRRGKLHLQFLLWLQRVGGHTMQPIAGGVEAAPSIDWESTLTHVPLRDADLALGRHNTAWREWMANRTRPDYWEGESHFRDAGRVTLPVLHITGWYDGSLVGELEMYASASAEGSPEAPRYLLIGPWDHEGTRTSSTANGHLDFGEAARLDMDQLHLEWFDQWLKGTDTSTRERRPSVRVFTMGENAWHDLSQWPPPARAVRWYLHSSGSANSSEGAGELSLSVPEDEPADSYLYDPADPTPSAASLNDFLQGPGPLDHIDRGFVEARRDVLVYTSAPLSEQMTITGTPVVRLWAASSAVDTDFAATLCQVEPSGRSTIIAEGLIRTTFREGAGPAAPVPAGTAYQYEISLNPTSVQMPAGSRLRLDVTSAEFPAYNRNPNTGGQLADDEAICVATQQVMHSVNMPSHLEVPVLEDP